MSNKIEQLIIEKGMPIPNRKWGKYTQIAEDMEVGDSILIKTRKEAIRLRSAIYNTGAKAIMRKLDFEEYRVWKN